MRKIVVLLISLFCLGAFGAVQLPDLNGSTPFKTNSYLSNADFPNSTFLYRWVAPNTNGNWTAAYGSIPITTVGTLSVAADHLENNKAIKFPGSTYLVSGSPYTTGDVAISFWMKRDSWSTNFYSIGEVIVSNFSSASSGNGWYIVGTGNTTLIQWSVATTGVVTLQGQVDTGLLPSGWHHFVFVRTTGGSPSTKIYIDGMIVSSTLIATSFSALGNFEIGSAATGNFPLGYSSYAYLQDVAVHAGGNNTIYTPEAVKKLFARGSKRGAILNPDSTIDINLPLEGKKFNCSSSMNFGGGSTAPTGGTLNKDCSYSVLKNMVYVKAQYGMYKGTNGSGYVTLNAPIIGNAEYNFGGCMVNRIIDSTSIPCLIQMYPSSNILAIVGTNIATGILWGTGANTFDGSDATRSTILTLAYIYFWQ